MCCMRSVIVENSAAGQDGPRQLCPLRARSREFAMADPLVLRHLAPANQMASTVLCLLQRPLEMVVMHQKLASHPDLSLFAAKSETLCNTTTVTCC